MAIRPVFEASIDGEMFHRNEVEFNFYSGFSVAQKKKSINSLHQEYLKKNTEKKILEISSKSNEEIGIRLSAFNLMIETKHGQAISVESAFQGSKIFEKGGPYIDLLYKTSKEAKKDERLRNSGKIKGFQIFGQKFGCEPKTFFYNWLYINALYLHKDLVDEIVKYDAFTDIEFNPHKSINCQAEAAAIFVSLYRQEMITEALENKQKFKEIVYANYDSIAL